MHRSCRTPLSERARTALSLILLSWAALTPRPAASNEAQASEVAETALFEIIVTARKRPQVLEDVPASISVVTAPMIEDTATRNLVDLAGQVAGMVFSLAPDDGLALTLRGVGTPARPQALDQSIALFLDGTYLAKGPLYPIALFDVERVEVVRGPHSTEVGKNASVGALSVVSREPGADQCSRRNGFLGCRAWRLCARGRCRSAARSGQRAAGGRREFRSARLGSQWRDGERRARRQRQRRSPDAALQTDGSAIQCPALPIQRSRAPRHRNAACRPTRIRAGWSRRFHARRSLVRVHAARSAGRIAPRYARPHCKRTLRLQCGRLTTGCRKQPGSTSMPRRSTISTSAQAQMSIFCASRHFTSSPRNCGSRHPRVEASSTSRACSFSAAAGTRSRTEYWNVPGFPPGDPLEGQLFNGPFTNDFDQDTRSAAVFANGTWRATDRMRVFAGSAPDG